VIRLALEELNARGGVRQRPLAYLVEDIQSKPGESATAVKKLTSRDRVAVMIGAILAEQKSPSATRISAPSSPRSTRPGPT
jgi:branched-chain amino acid transport system substrate-binding protein